MIDRILAKRYTMTSIIWHGFRYLIATCISSAALGSIPTLVALPFVLVCLFFFCFFLIGGLSASMSFWSVTVLPLLFLHSIGYPLDYSDPEYLIDLSLMIVLLIIVVIPVILMSSFAITVTVVLPTALLSEFVCRWLLSCRIPTRLVVFLLAGALLGTVISGCVLLVVQPQSLLLMMLIVVLGVSVFALIVFLFGLTLTLMESIKNCLVHQEDIWRRAVS